MIIESPFNGKVPKIHPTAFIASDVVIIGDVEIGAYTNVWFGAKIRGDWGKIVIGKNTSIQDNAVIHSKPNETCQIGNDVRLAHCCMVHGSCIIGNSSLVGINATVLEGSILGKGSTLAANSVLRGETEDFCLYAGVPAIIKKKYSQNRLSKFGVNIYVKNGQKFKKAGYGQKIPNEYLMPE